MKKYEEIKRDNDLEVNAEEQTALVEKASFGVMVKEVGSEVIHNKWVKRVGAGIALATAGVVGYILGDKFGSHGEDDVDDDPDAIDVEAVVIDESPADE